MYNPFFYTTDPDHHDEQYYDIDMKRVRNHFAHVWIAVSIMHRTIDSDMNTGT